MPEFHITGRACGEFSMTIEADDEQDAREQAETLAESANWIPMLDACDFVSVGGVQEIVKAEANDAHRG